MKKNNIFITILFLAFIIVSISKILYICVHSKDKYEKLYSNNISKTFTGQSSPRGKILDVNGKVLVDNKGVKTVIYNKSVNSKTDEVDIAYKLSNILTFDKNASINQLKSFYLVINDNGKDLITKEEYDLYEKRKLTSDDILSLKLERITDTMLGNMSELDKKAAYVYYLLSNGYSYQDKVIKKGITDSEMVLLNELNIKSLRIDLTWERVYPYGDVLKSILGNISTNGIPFDLKEHYSNLKMDSTVGTSFLEYEYDNYLRGTDSVYKVSDTGIVSKMSDEVPGSDLYLSIDIDLELKLIEILKEEMINAKKAKNSELYNHSYVIIGDPNTGAIKALTGLQINKDHFVDITSNIISSSYTVGSVVKGATIGVGYEKNLIEEGKYVTDGCVKVYGVTEKCSWKSLGRINDLTALAYSSNYFQFLIAARLANKDYKWNAKLNVTSEHFNIYRSMLSSYGLGSITGIDLPNEKPGILGKTISDDLLLNLAIGQYDTYTPIELFQYINSIANNGNRIAPSLMAKIVSSDNIVIENKQIILNRVNLSEQYLNRVQEGFREVMAIGTGKNYTSGKFTSAGKTGTSETFIDTNGDGKMDTKTISTAFVMYAPFEKPKYSIAIISPNIAKSESEKTYKYSINLRVNKKITEYLFENM